MKREILFRGKRLDSGGWEYGYPHNGFIGTMIIDPDGIVPDGGEYGYGLDKYCLVDSATVGQFTGLCDKNGVKIFEGDKLYCEAQLDKAEMYVVFEKGQFRMVLCDKFKEYETGRGYYDINCFQKTVIGNIHDTPELGLEEEAE